MFIVNVEAAIYNENKWLIIERSKKEAHAAGLLSLVGGKAELEGNTNDILERTLKREVREEVGVSLENNLQYVNSTSFVTDAGEHVVDVVFMCAHESGEAKVKSPDEVESVHWMTPEEVYEHPNAPEYLKASIRRAEELKTKLFTL